MSEPAGTGDHPVDARIPAAFRSATEADPWAPVRSAADEGSEAPAASPVADPLRLCVATTVALLAWLVTPPVAVVAFGTLAAIGYARARRAGLLSSRCRLGDTRLVLAYLLLAVAAGAVGIVLRVA